jgi:hypothetical protein
MKKERHVCAAGEPAVSEAFHVCGRTRDGQAAVSCENEAGGLFQQPAGHAKMPTVL